MMRDHIVEKNALQTMTTRNMNPVRYSSIIINFHIFHIFSFPYTFEMNTKPISFFSNMKK